MHEGTSTDAAVRAEDEAEIERRFAIETRAEIARRMPVATALFLSMMSVAFVIELIFYPARLVPLSACYVSLAAVCGIAIAAIGRYRESAEQITLATVLVLETLLTLYLTFVSGSGELVLLAMIGYLTGVVVQFPWGAPGQSAACAFALVLFSASVVCGASQSLPFPYSMFALTTHAVMTILGAHLLHSYRWSAFRAAAEAEHHAALSERANRAKSEFLSTVSHELRTPLNIIFGYTDLLLEDELGDAGERRDALTRIRQQSGHLLDLIQTMLDINRIEDGRIPVERQEFTVGELMERLRVNIPANWLKDSVELSWETEGPAAQMNSDRGKVEMIVRNLVHNALKYTDRGRVRVTAKPLNGARMRVIVDDTGCGIPPADVERIFELFEQSRNGPPREGSFGLGLFLAKQLSELLGGAIEVSSEVGVGSRFTVTLPLQAPKPDAS